MLESRPPSFPGALFGYLLLVALILLDLGLLLLLLNQPVTVLSFLWGVTLLASFPVFAFTAFWTSSLSASRYLVEADTLAIEWGRIRQVISLTEIRSMVMGETVQKIAKFKGVRWPGYLVGQGFVTGVDQPLDERPTVFYATRSLPQQLLLVTDNVIYGLSPVDLNNFVDCLQALRAPELYGRTDALTTPRGFLNWRIWRDWLVLWTLPAAILLNGALFAYLCTVYGRLPLLVPLHFDFAGTVDRTTSPANLFVLPVLGFLSWALNGALGLFFYQVRHERPPAFILWGSAIAVQIVTWAALFGLLA